jgi:hypothetical protein
MIGVVKMFLSIVHYSFFADVTKGRKRRRNLMYAVYCDAKPLALHI